MMLRFLEKNDYIIVNQSHQNKNKIFINSAQLPVD